MSTYLWFGAACYFYELNMYCQNYKLPTYLSILAR